MITARYFKESEFTRCSPACSLQDMDQNFMDTLDAIRSLAGIPLVLNSAYRSLEHEVKMGRSGTSSHCKGIAADIRCNSDSNRWKIIDAARRLGVKRFGIGKNYIHIDIDREKTQEVIWHYY